MNWYWIGSDVAALLVGGYLTHRYYSAVVADLKIQLNNLKNTAMKDIGKL